MSQINSINLKKEFSEKGYCIMRNHSSKIIPKLDNIISELNVIGKSIQKNFNLADVDSVKDVNNKTPVITMHIPTISITLLIPKLSTLLAIFFISIN